jgi:hypothetical protein
MYSVFSFWICEEGNMTRDDIIRMAGHREVPAWVLKLVMDCVEVEREACAKVWKTTMNRDDIIRMAHKAGFSDIIKKGVWVTDGCWDEELERFAELVAAAIQEKTKQGE